MRRFVSVVLVAALIGALTAIAGPAFASSEAPPSDQEECWVPMMVLEQQPEETACIGKWRDFDAAPLPS